MSEESKEIEKQSSIVSEPAAEIAYDSQTIEASAAELGISDSWDPGIGPYSMDELNVRIDKAEIAIKRAKNGDWSGWISESQSSENLYKKISMAVSNSYIITTRK
jgi:hypothetical protein